MIWRMFMSATVESATFMGKNYLDNRHSITNTKDLTLKQMFDISARLVSEQDEISGVETIGWENHSWKYLSLISDERVINLQRTKVYVFSDSVTKILENTQLNDAWEQRLRWLKSSQNYRNLDRIDGESMEFEWHIFPGFNTLQLCQEVKHLLLRLSETPENFTWRTIFMSMFNDISCGSRGNEKMRVECSTRFSVCKEIWKRTSVISWSWFWEEVVLYQWRQSTRSMGQYGWKDLVGIRRKWMSNFPRYGPIIQRSTQKQRTWKTVDTLCSRFGNNWNYFSHKCLCKSAQSLRTNRGNVWRIWIPSWKNGAAHCDGAIEFFIRAKRDQDRSIFGLRWPCSKRSSIAANMDNELKSYLNRTNWANLVWMQDFWLLLKSDNTSWPETLQNSHNSQMQWLVVSTHCQETKKHRNRKAGSKGTPRLGPYWKLQPVACTVSTELRSALCLWTETILTPGSEFLRDQTSWSRTSTTMSSKLQKCSAKNIG